MHAKSSAKLGEVKGYRGGKRQKGERSTARAWCTAGWKGLPRTAHPALATAACRGTTRGSTWSDHGVRATSEVANSRESEAALGDWRAGGHQAPWCRRCQATSWSARAPDHRPI